MKALTIERNSPAIRNNRLIESIGIETIGGVFAPLLQAGAAVPATHKAAFSTAADNQEQLILDISRGNEELSP